MTYMHVCRYNGSVCMEHVWSLLYGGCCSWWIILSYVCWLLFSMVNFVFCILVAVLGGYFIIYLWMMVAMYIL
jgi:hypothetical protein